MAAPVATDDSYSTSRDQTLNVAAPGVLANDSDADSDPLTAAKVSDPMNGVLTLNANGSFTYDPDIEFCGSDSFSYDVSDGTASDQGVVALTVTAPYGCGGGGNGGGGGYGGGAMAPGLLMLLALVALYRRGLNASKRRAISP